MPKCAYGAAHHLLIHLIFFSLVSLVHTYYFRHGRPKQFATVCGIIFSGFGSLCFLLASLLNVDIILYIGIGFMGGLAVATGMEGFLDFCVGCVIFKYGILLGIIPK